MLFLFLFFIGISDSGAQEPNMSITVNASRYQEVYMEDPRVICTTPCSFDQDTSLVFLEANRKHKTWYKKGNITGIYNDETIGIAYSDCDWRRNSLKCANDNSVWVLRTIIMQNEDKASINVMMFDETGVMIGQGTISRNKKVTIVERQRTTQQQAPGQPMSITNCSEQSGNCATIPITPQGQTATQVEDLEPSIVTIPPVLLDRDVGQAMIHMYDSIRVK